MISSAALDKLETLMRFADDKGVDNGGARFEARVSPIDIPTHCCQFAVVDRNQGIEVARIWDEAEARLYQELRNLAPELLKLARDRLEDTRKKDT
jgi:hypothetical protein